jgi:MoaA/NifB/PqqE/SkfB family radical SAM enzyme
MIIEENMKQEDLDISLNPTNLFRLPWNLCDNTISWLEPTSFCNLYCDGCYRENRKDSHKSLEEIEHELDIFAKYRKTDGVSIAGGEPLTHPQLLEICKLVVKKGWKPIINSNGALITRELLKDLKKVGVTGFTFHVDSNQVRKGYEGKNEIELNELRLELAEMLAEFHFSCSFNATIYPETLKYIPDLLKFGQKHIDKVNVMVFILYRMAVVDQNIDFYKGDEKVKFDDMWYAKVPDNRRVSIMANEVVDLIRKEVDPYYRPSAFLNGTEKPDSFKWLLTNRVGNKHQIFGYCGPRFMELVQNWKHFWTGSYLAYAKPKELKLGRSIMNFMSLIDKDLKVARNNLWKSLFKNPKAFFSKSYSQSIMIIQPADIMSDGNVNMCDGCPDITVWKDKLVWSCRMEEQNRWGQNVRMVPHEKVYSTKHEYLPINKSGDR